MGKTVLEVKNLQVSFQKSDFELKPLDFSITEGESVAIVGESGSGKSTFLKAITCLSDEDATVSGEAILKDVDLLKMSDKDLREYRFKRFSVVFQNSKEYLNPRLSLREMLYEILRKEYPASELSEKAENIIREVGLEIEVLNQYVRELSGGMVQKFQIACATALSPELIVFDEPTSSLDAASRNEFIQLVQKLKNESKRAIIIVTHDMALARELTDRIMVMYRGVVCEEGVTEAVLTAPRHPYSRALFNTAMEMNLYKDVWGIREADMSAKFAGCPFFGRCTQSCDDCSTCRPERTQLPEEKRWIACNRGGIIRTLECRNIRKSFGKKQVLMDCSFDLYAGEIVSLIGRSGSGKTTMCNIVSGFLKGEGEVLFEGKKMDRDKAYRRLKGFQFIMQDHSDSLDQHVTIYDAINEPLYLFLNKEPHHNEVKKILADVGLESDDAFLNRKIGTLSGGQRQRVAVARALITEPSVLLADEPTSMLDGSSKANLIRLLKGIQNEKGFSMLIVTHDLACALKISDRVFLLQNGSVRELDKSLSAVDMEKMLYDSAAK